MTKMLRTAIALAGAGLSGACLLADPPEPPPPEQTAPVLDLVKAEPSITKIHTLRRLPSEDLTVTFTIPFRSNDLGDEVVAVPFLDFEVDGDDVPAAQPSFRDPSTLDDRNREPFRIRWTPRRDVTGCHQFTVLVTHFQNYDFDTNRTADSEDVALITWWLNIEDPDAGPTLMSDCPGG